MFDLYFVLRSVTFGQRGKELLSKSGIPCRLLRAPREIAPSGCGYAIVVRREHAVKAAGMFSDNHLPFAGPYLRAKDGTFREWGI